MAAERGVRVVTIGFGTTNNSAPMNCAVSSPYQMDPFGSFFGGGGGGGGMGFRRDIDEDTLMLVAEMTGGSYHLAESAVELREVYENLPTHFMMVTETTEVGAVFAAAAALLMLAIVLSMIWNPLM
jgi:Ca-activated chloride channel family protein